MKNDKNIYKLARELVDRMDFGAMEEAALISQVVYLNEMNEEEFVEEWKYVMDEEPEDTEVLTTLGNAVNVFYGWLKKCEVGRFCAVFDNTFGTVSTYDPETGELSIIPKEEVNAEFSEGYSGILKEFKK